MSRRRIAFVDGDKGVLAGLRRMLSPLHDRWDVQLFDRPEDALRAEAVDGFDVVASEISLPGMDGLRFLDEMRERSPNTVRFLLSGQATAVQKLRTTGVAHHYVTKPCTAATLERCVNRAASLRHHFESPHLVSTVARTKALPSAPTLYRQLVAEVRSDDPSLARIGALVRKDPAATAQVMRVVNSAYFGLRRRVADIGQAVTLLGINTIMGLVLSSHMFRQARLSPTQADVIEGLWRRSVANADLARAIMFSDASTRQLAEEAYLAGLLSECGKLVFAINWPVDFVEIERSGGAIATEQGVFGADHALVGGYLLALWGLPDDIVEAVAYRFTPSQCEAGGSKVLAAVHAAQVLSRRSDLEDEPAFDMPFLDQMGLTHLASHWVGVAAGLAGEREYA